MLDQAIRFGAILQRSEFNSGGTLLEVGSGRTGIGAFVDDVFVGVDLRFDAGISPPFIAITASATALPFRNGAFSRVVCSDVLEHLTDADRTAAIRELVRVTQNTLFLACPTGKTAGFGDTRLMNLYHFLSVHPPVWLREHLENRLPDPQIIRAALRDTGKRFYEVKGESCITHILVSLLISTKRLNRFWRSLFYQQPARAIRAAVVAKCPGGPSYRRLWVVDCTSQSEGAF